MQYYDHWSGAGWPLGEKIKNSDLGEKIKRGKEKLRKITKKNGEKGLKM